MRIFSQVILPLTRPALAALGALSTTWIYNDLLWSIIAAATVVAAIPTAIVFLVASAASSPGWHRDR